MLWQPKKLAALNFAFKLAAIELLVSCNRITKLFARQFESTDLHHLALVVQNQAMQYFSMQILQYKFLDQILETFHASNHKTITNAKEKGKANAVPAAAPSTILQPAIAIAAENSSCKLQIANLTVRLIPRPEQDESDLRNSHPLFT